MQIEGARLELVKASVALLQQSIKVDEVGAMIEVDPGNDWVVHENTSGAIDYKFTAINQTLGIVVKQYTPMIAAYAETINMALQELSKLNLKNPILPPAFETGNALVFPLGTFQYAIGYEGEFDLQERVLIEEIVRTKDLCPLSLFDRVEVVEVNGKSFVIDPIDDSEWQLAEFYANLQE